MEDSIQICPDCHSGGHYSSSERQTCPNCRKKMRKLSKTQKAFYIQNGCYCASWFEKKSRRMF